MTAADFDFVLNAKRASACTAVCNATHVLVRLTGPFSVSVERLIDASGCIDAAEFIPTGGSVCGDPSRGVFTHYKRGDDAPGLRPVRGRA